MHSFKSLSLLSGICVMALTGAATQNAFAKTEICASSRGAVTVTDHVLQLTGEEPVAVTREVGRTDIYRSQDGRTTLQVDNPSYAGAHCKISKSPLPHTDRMSICRAQLQWEDGRIESLACYISSN